MDRKMLQTPMMFPDVVSGLLWLPPDSSSSANEYLSLSFMLVPGDDMDEAVRESEVNVSVLQVC